MKDYDAVRAHLSRTGRLKLLPHILRELKVEAERAKKLAPRKETAQQHPSLISGWRTIEGGTLIDRSGKGALIEIYRQITA